MIGPFSVGRTKRFAHAVDPVSCAHETQGSSGRDDSPPDPQLRQLVTIVDDLRAADFNGAPSPEFKARLRARLLAVAAVQLAGEPELVPEPHPARRARLTARLARMGGPRLASAAAALTVLVALSGVTLVASHNALPGDPLYALKRKTEHIELALARNDEAKAHRHLDFATTRATELRDLVDKAPTTPVRTASPPPLRLDADQTALVSSTLQDMDRDTRNGARLLTTYAVSKSDRDALDALATWEAQQQAMLGPMVERLTGAAADRGRDSADLLSRIHNRVVALRAQFACTCLDHATGDDLGPLPCLPCNPPKPPQVRATEPTTTTGPGGGGNSPSPGQQPTVMVTPEPGQSPLPGGSPPTPLPTGTGSPAPSLPPATGDPSGGGPLPTLLPPNPLPPLPSDSQPPPLLPGLPDLLPGLFGA